MVRCGQCGQQRKRDSQIGIFFDTRVLRGRLRTEPRYKNRYQMHRSNKGSASQNRP